MKEILKTFLVSAFANFYQASKILKIYSSVYFT